MDSSMMMPFRENRTTCGQSAASSPIFYRLSLGNVAYSSSIFWLRATKSARALPLSIPLLRSARSTT